MDKRIVIDYKEYTNVSFLTEIEQEMILKAQLIAKQAYSPYSNFNVGASLLLESGEVVLANNQENAAYPSGLCAERVALFYAGANFPLDTVNTLVIVAKGDLLKVDQIITPCGSCRQVMLESEKRQDKPIKIILTSQNGKVIVFSSVLDLLPFSFGFQM